MTNVSELIGIKYNKLTISKSDGFRKCNNGTVNGGRRQYVIVICDCGNHKSVRLSRVISGQTKSCGCLQAESGKENATHGLTGHPLYGVWATIKTRCYNKKHPNYRFWGAKGVRMCDEWKGDFMKFYNWCMANGWRVGLQIDKDIKAISSGQKPDLYSPERCQFVTPEKNSNNRKNTVRYELDGHLFTLSELSRKYNIHPETLRSRVKKQNLSISEAINK